MPELSAKEAEVYDRQLRVWGVETQKRCAGVRQQERAQTCCLLTGVQLRRLNAARIVVVGCTGLAAEVRCRDRCTRRSPLV